MSTKKSKSLRQCIHVVCVASRATGALVNRLLNLAETMANRLDYVTKLSPEMLQKCKDLWDEDDLKRNQILQIIRDWIKQQPHFTCRTGKTSVGLIFEL